MKIVFKDPTKLVHYANNSKLHPPEQVDAIAVSIKAFGFDQPVVVDAHDVIIKGHGRTLAAIKLGLKNIPVVVREDISENDARFLREVDNQIQSADWDVENLGSELRELQGLGKLEFTLFAEADIPQLPQFVVAVKQEEFDATTKHTCRACDYKW